MAAAKKALRLGAEYRTTHLVRWHFAGECQTPSLVVLTWRYHELEMLTPCRKCEPCRHRRGYLWRCRALEETVQAPRTWFVTLTLSPEEHHQDEMAARAILRPSRVLWGDLDDETQFKLRCRVGGKHITTYLKRVRKHADDVLKRAKRMGKIPKETPPVRLRYLLVAEQHKSGLPHWHLLIHEVQGKSPVRKMTMKTRWRRGHSDVKLVTHEPDEVKKAARYVAKYISKSALARVRASVRYGKPAHTLSA